MSARGGEQVELYVIYMPAFRCGTLFFMAALNFAAWQSEAGNGEDIYLILPHLINLLQMQFFIGEALLLNSTLSHVKKSHTW